MQRDVLHQHIPLKQQATGGHKACHRWNTCNLNAIGIADPRIKQANAGMQILADGHKNLTKFQCGALNQGGSASLNT